jgi:hypothetical protein
VRQPALEHVLAPELDVVAVQRLDVESAEAALDMVGIDREHGRDIVLGGGAHDDFAGLVECRRVGRHGIQNVHPCIAS